MKALIRHKVSLVLGFALVALIMWALFLYQPTLKRLGASRAQAALLEQEVNSARQFLTSTAQAMDNDGWLQQRQKLLTNLSRVDSLESFVNRLTADFNSFGIMYAEFAPDLHELLKERRIPLGSVILTGSRFDAHCQGRYLSLGKAIEYLEQQPYFSDLHSLTIQYNDATNPDVLCTMNFSVYLRDREVRHD